MAVSFIYIYRAVSLRLKEVSVLARKVIDKVS